MSEWLKEHAWKACVRETVPRVRIPPSPPVFAFGLGRGESLWRRGRVRTAVPPEGSTARVGGVGGARRAFELSGVAGECRRGRAWQAGVPAIPPSPPAFAFGLAGCRGLRGKQRGTTWLLRKDAIPRATGTGAAASLRFITTFFEQRPKEAGREEPGSRATVLPEPRQARKGAAIREIHRAPRFPRVPPFPLLGA